MQLYEIQQAKLYEIMILHRFKRFLHWYTDFDMQIIIQSVINFYSTKFISL